MKYVELSFMGYDNYVIGEDGNVYVKDTMELIKPELSERKTCMVVDLYKGLKHRKFNLAGLMVKAFDIKLSTSNGELNYSQFKDLKWRLVYKDGNNTNTSLDNILIIDELYYLGSVGTKTTDECVKGICKNVFDEQVLSHEEAYALIFNATSIAYKSRKYPILVENYSIEDLFSTVYMVLLERDAFSKFDRKKATKKTYVSRIVNNALIDMTRTFKESYSLDFTISGKDGSSMTFEEIVEDKEDAYNDLLSDELVLQLINSLSDSTSKPVYGNSPIIGTCCLTQRTVALHLYLGYSNKEIQEMFDVTSKMITKYKKQIQEELSYILDNYKEGYDLAL